MVPRNDLTSSAEDQVPAQRRYYTETTSRYDAMRAHVAVDDGIQMLISVLSILELRGLLEIGSATGRDNSARSPHTFSTPAHRPALRAA